MVEEEKERRSRIIFQLKHQHDLEVAELKGQLDKKEIVQNGKLRAEVLELKNKLNTIQKNKENIVTDYYTKSRSRSRTKVLKYISQV